MSSKLTYVSLPVEESLRLIANREKIILTLSNANDYFQFNYGASEFVKEDINQNIVMFGVAGVNGSYVQVTGSDAKKITWSGMFYSSNAIKEKEGLEDILNTGNPLSFTAIYNSKPYKVIVQSVSFDIFRECYIKYNIVLVEYNPIIFSMIKQDYWTDIPEKFVTDPATGGLKDNNPCITGLRFNCSSINPEDYEIIAKGKQGTSPFDFGSQLKNLNLDDQILIDIGKDIIGCNNTIPQNDTKFTGFLNSIINALGHMFLYYLRTSSFYSDETTTKSIDLTNCLGSSLIDIPKAFESFLINGCYRIDIEHVIMNVVTSTTESHIHKDIKMFSYSNGSLCFSDAFIALINESNKLIAGYTLLVYGPKLDKNIKFVEVPKDCALKCNESGGSVIGDDKSTNTDKSFTIELIIHSDELAVITITRTANTVGDYNIVATVPTPGGTTTEYASMPDGTNSVTFRIDISGFTVATNYNFIANVYAGYTQNILVATYNKVIRKELKDSVPV
ncbi:MAG: hypothetical protein WC346_08425 [Methanogenium sp.]|jgi:hypothetical protein